MNSRLSARLMASALAVLAPAGLLTACSGNDSSDTTTAASQPSTAVAATDTAGADSTDSTDGTADTADTADDSSVPDLGDLSPECAQLTEFITALTKAGTGESFDGLSAAVASLSDSVPADLQDEVATLAGAYGQMETIISGYDGDVAAAMADPAVQQQIDDIGTDEVVDAGDKISAYFDTQCPELADS